VLQGALYGSVCMGLRLMTGVSRAPAADTFFLWRQFRAARDHRHQATCQVASHLTKRNLFRGIIDQAATLDPLLALVAVAASMLAPPVVATRRAGGDEPDGAIRAGANWHDHHGCRSILPVLLRRAAWFVAKSSALTFVRRADEAKRSAVPLRRFRSHGGRARAAGLAEVIGTGRLMPAADDLEDAADRG